MTILERYDIKYETIIATGCMEGAMKETVTIYTLAEELGMTPSMVSRALNPNGKIAEEKRQRVLEAARKHQFMPNKFASRLSRRQVHIGILIYSRADHVREQMLQGIQMAYEKVRDYKVEYLLKVVECSDKEPWECERELFDLVSCEGVILAGFSQDKCRDMLQRFINRNPNVVFLQNMCEETDYLFASKHDETLASELAAELLENRLHGRQRRNVLLFTGEGTGSVHIRAAGAFAGCCGEYGLNLLDIIDMHDSESYVRENISRIMESYKGQVDGIYITSGNSVALCDYVQREMPGTALVTFDVYAGLATYIRNGTVCATIFQDIVRQAENAFDKLVSYLIEDEVPEREVFTNVLAVMKSNLRLYI